MTDPTQTETVKIGFLPLIDCAPFVVAKEQGFFEEEGLNVILSKEASWASVRDKVAFNILDGAHMLASLPIAASLGLGSIKIPMQTSFVVSHNGNGITVSNNLYEKLSKLAHSHQDIRDGSALKRLLVNRTGHQTPLRFAVVYSYSSHHYQLREWLSRASINPDSDVQIIVATPTQMIDYLKSGEIDGYCVGEPWNSLAVEQGVGHMLVTGYEIWGSTPEKVFGVNSEWAQHNRPAHEGVIRALNRACHWVDDKANQNQLLSLLSHSDYLNTTVDKLRYGFAEIKPQGEFDWPMEAYQVFSGSQINIPLPSYGLWLMGQMYRWQQLKGASELNQFIVRVFRQDLYFSALGIEPTQQGFTVLSPQQERSWLEDVASGRVTLSKEGILKGFQF
ncbi:CmpA/NrtA family ABC transporter substrate-binding protein [Marinomonas epiphytica]